MLTTGNIRKLVMCVTVEGLYYIYFKMGGFGCNVVSPICQLFNDNQSVRRIIMTLGVQSGSLRNAQTNFNLFRSTGPGLEHVQSPYFPIPVRTNYHLRYVYSVNT